MHLEAAIAYVGGDFGPTPGAMMNIIFRVALNFGAAIACWVPMNLFHKNGELSGTAMVIATALLNFYYACNALIWPDNDISNWATGYGWCDFQLATFIPLETLNAAAVCAVMQNIANQVSLMRASGLTSDEKRRKHIIQALIVFPLPALQFVLYYFVIAMRYNISGIIGCQAVFESDWVFLVFFILPCPLFAVAAAYFAALTWWRYRKIDATSRRALWASGNHGAQARSARTRRRLYFMALTIVAPYCPLQLMFLLNNITLGMPWSTPYSLERLHAPGWNRIDYAPSTVVSFTSMYINYIAALEVMVFYLYFGGTKEAHEMYRRYLRALGLGKIFPKLNEEWYPSDRPPTSLRNVWPRAKSISSFVTSIHRPSSSVHESHTRFSETHSNSLYDHRALDIRLNSLDLEAARIATDAARCSDRTPQVSSRSPWPFRMPLTQHFDVPRMPWPAISRKKNEDFSVLLSRPRITEPVVHYLHTSRPYPLRAHRAGMVSEDTLAADQYVGNESIRKVKMEEQNADSVRIVGDTSQSMTADFERGLISIKRDFSSPARGPTSRAAV